MGDLGTYLATGLTLLAVATAVGFGLQRGRIAQLQGRLKESDEEIARKDRRLTEAETELQTVKADLEALTRVVTGEAHLVALEQRLDEHHTKAEHHWQRDEEILEEIRDRLPRSTA